VTTVAEYALVDPTPAKVTERDMLDLLLARYDKTVTNGDWKGHAYLRAEHVPVGLRGQRYRIADFIATGMQSYSNGQWGPDRVSCFPPVFHGHEVKVSRSDWLTELKDPGKAEVFRRHMHFWWLVVSDRSIVRDDLPDEWGLMVKAGGRLRIVRQAPLLDPEPMRPDMVGALMRATANTEARARTADTTDTEGQD